MIRRLTAAALSNRAHDPISPSEFLDQLSKIWRPREASGGLSQGTKIGLCVSGGPDSMALAYLFQQLKTQDIEPKIDLTALVVDHNHRTDSHQESLTVSTWLRELGIKSRNLQITWPPGQDPAQLTSFESTARVLRYRQFAYGCLDQDIKTLFLGHHLADQVETIILRLYRGQRVASAGLSGMKPVHSIPCCRGIFGASDGSETSSLPRLMGHSTPLLTTENRDRLSAPSPVIEGGSFPGGIHVSHGGIRTYRPLLSFAKSRLIATCEANSIPFVNDPSNFDPKTAPRNAVRWLLSNDKMPRALRQDSIVRLGAAATKLGQSLDKKLTALMNATLLVHFDIRSGRLMVLVPKDITKTYNANEQEASYYVDHLLRLVSPHEEITESAFRRVAIARTMFPELLDAASFKSDRSIDTNSFTVRGVLIEPSQGFSDRLWVMSRRPFRALEDHQSTFVPAPFYSKGTDRDWSRWIAWDARYWIRIRTRNPEDVRNFQVRALRPADMAVLNAERERLPVQSRQALRTLGGAAPGRTRYTLPVLVKGSQARVLPTFDLEFPSESTDEKGAGSAVLTEELQWEVRYKDITDTLQYLKRSASNGDGLAKPTSLDNLPASSFHI